MRTGQAFPDDELRLCTGPSIAGTTTYGWMMLQLLEQMMVLPVPVMGRMALRHEEAISIQKANMGYARLGPGGVTMIAVPTPWQYPFLGLDKCWLGHMIYVTEQRACSWYFLQLPWCCAGGSVLVAHKLHPVVRIFAQRAVKFPTRCFSWYLADTHCTGASSMCH